MKAGIFVFTNVSISAMAFNFCHTYKTIRNHNKIIDYMQVTIKPLAQTESRSTY